MVVVLVQTKFSWTSGLSLVVCLEGVFSLQHSFRLLPCAQESSDLDVLVAIEEEDGLVFAPPMFAPLLLFRSSPTT